MDNKDMFSERQNTEPLYSVTLGEIIKEFNLEILHAPEGMGERKIYTDEVNRPALQLAGFFDYFDPKRLQLIGRVETTYVEQFDREQRQDIFEKFLSRNIMAIIFSRSIDPSEECMEMAVKYNTPILRSSDTTSGLMSAVIAFLKVQLAPRITRHGVLVEVYGEGILLLGESGVGKSETAIELVKRGHRLIADDAVEIKRVSSKSLVGSAPELIRHYIELRGIGVVDVRRIFGMGAIKDTEKIDLILQIEIWKEDKHYDRLGLDDYFTNILGIDVPSLFVPVKPGRNLAVIVEVAAMNNRLKKMGYNAAREIIQRIDTHFENSEK